MVKELLIFQMGAISDDIIPGTFADMFLRAADFGRLQPVVIDATSGRLPCPDTDCAGIIITGSPAMVTDREPWSEQSADWLRQAYRRDRKILGVCYGHQLLAHALGGTVGYNAAGMELGSHLVTRRINGSKTHPLFAGLPESFHAHMAHSQSVLVPPPGATAMAASEHDPFQMLFFGESCFGLQFHPEFTGQILSAYSDHVMTQQGDERIRFQQPLEETPHATRVLQNFLDFCGA